MNVKIKEQIYKPTLLELLCLCSKIGIFVVVVGAGYTMPSMHRF